MLVQNPGMQMTTSQHSTTTMDTMIGSSDGARETDGADQGPHPSATWPRTPRRLSSGPPSAATHSIQSGIQSPALLGCYTVLRCRYGVRIHIARYSYQVDMAGRNVFACPATRTHASTTTKCITSRSSRHPDNEKKNSMANRRHQSKRLSACADPATPDLPATRQRPSEPCGSRSFRRLPGERPCPSSAT